MLRAQVSWPTTAAPISNEPDDEDACSTLREQKSSPASSRDVPSANLTVALAVRVELLARRLVNSADRYLIAYLSIRSKDSSS